MNCEAYDDRLTELALGTASPEQAQAVRNHLAGGCAQCAARLAELRAALAAIPLALPEQIPSPSVRAKLLQRTTDESAAATQSATSLQSDPMRAARMWRWRSYAALAVAASALIALGLAWFRLSSQNALLARQIEKKEIETNTLRRDLISEQEINSTIRSPAALMVSMNGAATPAGQGRIFIDAEQGKWWFTARGLKLNSPGRVYEFWLIPAHHAPIPAGTFQVDARGVGSLTGTVPPNIGANAVAAVTEEPDGGLPQPTGQIQIEGSIGN